LRQSRGQGTIARITPFQEASATSELFAWNKIVSKVMAIGFVQADVERKPWLLKSIDCKRHANRRLGLRVLRRGFPAKTGAIPLHQNTFPKW
jgi:hypothetical protein